jgi:anti-sigma B factor antagonist
MDVAVEQDAGVTVVTVSGDLEAGTAPALRDRLDGLLAEGVQNFVVDLGGVRFMDSAGIATLVQLFKRVRIGHGDVRLCSLQPSVEKIFKLVRLHRVFDTFPDRPAAVESYGDPGPA